MFPKGSTLKTSSFSAVLLPSSVFPTPLMTMNSPKHLLSLASHSISDTNVQITSIGLSCSYANNFLPVVCDVQFTRLRISVSHVSLSITLHDAPESITTEVMVTPPTLRLTSPDGFLSLSIVKAYSSPLPHTLYALSFVVLFGFEFPAPCVLWHTA